MNQLFPLHSIAIDGRLCNERFPLINQPHCQPSCLLRSTCEALLQPAAPIGILGAVEVLSERAGEFTMLLDILIVLLIIGGVAFGLWKGLLNQGLAILGVYLGALLGRFVYEPIARPIAATTTLDLHLVQLLVFLLIIIAVPVVVLVVAHAIWGSLRLPHAWGQVDLVGGTVLGGVVGLLAAMFLVLTFGFLVVTSHLNSVATTYPLFDQIQAAWSASLLRGPVVEVGHILYYSLLPNVGKTSPDILQVFAPR
jgi:uncharacterized membrane protein required for colicin V production